MTRARGSITLLRTNKQTTLFTRCFAAIAAMLCAILLLCAPISHAYADEAIDALEPGTYTINVTMAGGTGKATVESPVKLEVADGKAYATLVWSSENYDYMVVNGEKIMALTQKPTSQFKVPVGAFDTPLLMIGDTTAMGNAHEIEYSFTFDSSTLQKTAEPESAQTQQSQAGQSGASAAGTDTQTILNWVTIGSLIVALIAIGITIGVLRNYRKRR